MLGVGERHKAGMHVTACPKRPIIMGAEDDLGMGVTGTRVHEAPSQHLLAAQGARRGMDSVGFQVKCLLMEELEAELPQKWEGTAFAGLGFCVSWEFILTWKKIRKPFS